MVGWCPLCLTRTGKNTCPRCGTPVVSPSSEEGPLGGEPFLEERTGTFYVTEDQDEALLVWWSWYQQEDGSETEVSTDDPLAIPPVRDGVYLGRRYLAWPLPKRTLSLVEGLQPIEIIDFLEKLPSPVEFEPFEVVIRSDGSLAYLAGRHQVLPPSVPGSMLAAPERHLGAPVDQKTDDYGRAALLYVALARRYPLGVFEPPDPRASSLRDPDLTLLAAMRRNRSTRTPFSEVRRAYTPPSAVGRVASTLGAVFGTAGLLGFGALLVYAIYSMIS